MPIQPPVRPGRDYEVCGNEAEEEEIRKEREAELGERIEAEK